MSCAEGFGELVVTEYSPGLVGYVLLDCTELQFKTFDQNDVFGVISWSNIWLIDVFLFMHLPSNCLLDFFFFFIAQRTLLIETTVAPILLLQWMFVLLWRLHVDGVVYNPARPCQFRETQA